MRQGGFWYGKSGRDTVWLGKARLGKARQLRYGELGQGMVWHG